MTFEVIPEARSALDRYSLNALKTMARWRLDRWKEVRSKADLVVALRAAIYDSASIRAALASLDPTSREALGLLKRRGGTMSAAAMRGQIATWHPALPPETVHGVPGELVRRALAFWHVPVSPYGGMHDVQRPATDNEHSALIYSAPEVLDQVAPTDEPRGATLHPTNGVDGAASAVDWQRRILTFLRAIESRAPRVLQSGIIGARDREALGEVLGLARGPEGRDAPGVAARAHPVSFFRATFEAAGLIELAGNRVLRTTAEATRFVAASPVRQARTLLDAWLETGENELLALPHLRCDRRASTAGATNLPDEARAREAHRFLVDLVREHARPGEWYACSDLARLARWRDVEFLVSWRDPAPYRWHAYFDYRGRVASPTYIGITLEDSRGRSSTLTLGEDWDLVEGAFIRAVLRGPLTWLGIVAVATRPDGVEVFTLTPLGAQALDVASGSLDPVVPIARPPADALIVQPNFDVLVFDPEDRLDLLYQVDRIAERVSLDRLATYRLTRESVSSGLQLGLRIDDVLALLEGAARAPLPQNVVYTLRDWARRFEEVRFVRNGWLLEAPDEAALDRWLAIPSLRQAIDRRVSPTVALLTGTRPPDLAEVLAAQGADVRVVDAADPLVPCARVEDETTLAIPAADANLYLQTRLAAFAETLPAEDGSFYGWVTPQSIGRARAAGWTVEMILYTLERVLRAGLPPGLRVRVKGWYGAYRPVEVGEVAILSAPDPETFRELRADPELAAGIIESISPTAAIVRLDALDCLRQALAARGVRVQKYAPRRVTSDE